MVFEYVCEFGEWVFVVDLFDDLVECVVVEFGFGGGVGDCVVWFVMCLVECGDCFFG